MKYYYETPSIEIVNYDSIIYTAEASVVIEFPWTDNNESEFFK